MSNNLGAPQVANNQDQKEITINTAIGRLDAALTETISYAVDGGFTVSATDFQSANEYALAAGTVAADFTMTVPGSPRGLFVVTNASGFTATVTVAGQPITAPTVATGAAALLWCNGTNVRAVATLA